MCCEIQKTQIRLRCCSVRPPQGAAEPPVSVLATAGLCVPARLPLTDAVKCKPDTNPVPDMVNVEVGSGSGIYALHQGSNPGRRT
jgi:hypothetical protein